MKVIIVTICLLVIALFGIVSASPLGLSQSDADPMIGDADGSDDLTWKDKLVFAYASFMDWFQSATCYLNGARCLKPNSTLSSNPGGNGVLGHLGYVFGLSRNSAKACENPPARGGNGEGRKFEDRFTGNVQRRPDVETADEETLRGARNEESLEVNPSKMGEGRRDWVKTKMAYNVMESGLVERREAAEADEFLRKNAKYEVDEVEKTELGGRDMFGKGKRGNGAGGNGACGNAAPVEGELSAPAVGSGGIDMAGASGAVCAGGSQGFGGGSFGFGGGSLGGGNMQ